MIDFLSSTFRPGASVGRARFVGGHVVGVVVVVLASTFVGLLAMVAGGPIRTALLTAAVGVLGLGLVAMSSLLVANRLRDMGVASWPAWIYAAAGCVAMFWSGMDMASVGGAARLACAAALVTLLIGRSRD